MANQAPFPIRPDLVAIAIAYKNTKLIADDVLPRTPVVKKDFTFQKYALADGFTIPDTRVGRKSAPNEVEFSGTETPGTCEDFGLDDPVPQDDLDQATEGQDPLGRATEYVADLIALDREKRVADLVFNAANYATANKVTLSGTSQWSDFVNSNPIADVMGALDAMVMRGNVMVIGRLAFSKLVQHPKIAKAVLGNAGDVTIATRQQIAALFELEDVLVGEAWLNTAKRGVAPVLSRVWGRHCALIYRSRLADTKRGTTYGYTAQYGQRIAGTIPDPKIGIRGGQRVRVAETVKEVIAANDLGYLFTNAIA